MHLRPAALVLVTLVASLLAIVGGVQPAGARPVDDAPTATTLTLDSAKVNADWKESWLKGNVAFSGTVGGAAELKAALRRVKPGHAVVAAKSFSAGPGGFSGTLGLPHRSLPGTYVLRVTGKSGGAKLAPVEETLTLPAPPEGIADRAVISLKPGGHSVRRVRKRVRQLFARFHFLVPPDVHRVRILWRTPQFNFVGEVRKPYKKSVDSFIKSSRPLAKGTWYCLLQVNEDVTKRIAIRIG